MIDGGKALDIIEWSGVVTLHVKNQTYAINIVFSRPTPLHVEKTVNGKGGIIVGCYVNLGAVKTYASPAN